jgi:hypothetical protein
VTSPTIKEIDMSPFVRCVAIVALACSMLVACGGEQAEQASPQAARQDTSAPSPAVTALKIYLVNSTRTPLSVAIATQLQGALVAAGYDLVDTGSAPHDLTARLGVTATQKQSFFEVTVNGRTRVNLAVHAALTLTGGGGIIDQMSADFDKSSGDPVSDVDVAPLVRQLGRSSRLGAFAANQARARRAHAKVQEEAAEQAKQQAAEQAETQVRQQDDADWVSAKPLGCRMPAALDACDAVRKYLATYPSGVHADEGKKALDEAAPKLETLQRDENTWKRSGADACRAHLDEHACDGIDIYLVKFPSGLHGDEARALTAKPVSQP